MVRKRKAKVKPEDVLGWADRPLFYKLKGKKVVPFEHDMPGPGGTKKQLLGFLDEMDEALRQRRVALDEHGDRVVSTVFLSMDMDIRPVPVVFETMVFGGKKILEQLRSATWEEAMRDHAAMVKRYLKS